MTETTGASAGARRSNGKKGVKVERIFTCLLYTSDAADE